MKKIFSIFAMCISVAAFAQNGAQQAAMDAANATSKAADIKPAKEKPNYWTNGISFDLGFNQAAMTNWAAGGYATIGLAAAVDAKANYAKNLTKWNNRLQLNYGFVWSADKANLLQSSNDRIYLESRWAHKFFEKSQWSYSAGLDFKTQFADTRDNYHQVVRNEKKVWEGDLKSTFLSPAYLNLALGLDWDPCNWLDVSIAPLTGGATIVTTESLRKSYGMEMITPEGLIGVPEQFKSIKWSLGTQVKANAKVAVNDWFSYETQVVLFGNYLGHKFTTTYDGVHYSVNDIWRVNWDNKINFNVAKYFKIGLQTWLIYDPSIVYRNGADGKYKARPVQFKEALSINFTYTIASKKK